MNFPQLFNVETITTDGVIDCTAYCRWDDALWRAQVRNYSGLPDIKPRRGLYRFAGEHWVEMYSAEQVDGDDITENLHIMKAWLIQAFPPSDEGES